MPLSEGEVHAVYKAKKRSCLIIFEGGMAVEKSLTAGKPKSQTAPTLLVAPYYGADEGRARVGYKPEFTKRVRCCEYPQFMWDKLPIGGNTEESKLRLDHFQPIGKHNDSIEFTNYRLSNQALDILDEWLCWLMTEEFDENSTLLLFKTDIGGVIQDAVS